MRDPTSGTLRLHRLFRFSGKRFDHPSAPFPGKGLDRRVLDEIPDLVLEGAGHATHLPGHRTHTPGHDRQPAGAQDQQTEYQEDQDLASTQVAHAARLALSGRDDAEATSRSNQVTDRDGQPP
jgi:hypothetical protein